MADLAEPAQRLIRTGGFGCAMLNSWYWPLVEATLVGTTRRLRRFANMR
jgi:hypothetical protein